MAEVPEQRFLDASSIEEFWYWANQYQQDSVRAAPPVGVATRYWMNGRKLLTADIALTTKDGSWIVRFGDDKTRDDIVGGVLRRVFLNKNAPMLASREVIEDAMILAKAMHVKHVDEAAHLARLFFFDLDGLASATGIQLRKRDEEWPLVLDSLDSSLTGPQYESALDAQARAWYKQVHLPIVQWKLRRLFVHERGEGRRYIIQYPSLFYRVIAYYSADPFLIRFFQENPTGDPTKELARKLEIEEQEVYPFMIWLCTGEDTEWMKERYPFLALQLPEKPELIKHQKGDREIPVIRLWSAEERQIAQQRRVDYLDHFKTIAGRPPKERSLPDLLNHKIAGSVRDLIDVTIASLLSIGEENFVVYDEDWWELVKIVGHTESKLNEDEIIPMLNWYDRLHPVPGGAKFVLD